MRRLKKSVKISIVIICGILVFMILLMIKPNNKMIDLSTKDVVEIKNYAQKHKLDLEVVERYDNDVIAGQLISQSIEIGNKINSGDKLVVYISLGKIDKDVYKEYGVNELGRVPIMMYHGIQNIENTSYIGGNIDKDGYHRTSKAFRQDLEFYYKEGYRMIKLSDYVNGKIDVPLGKSPIVLTFDDGLSNNILVTGLDENGDIIIDPNSAVGIMESFKEKYPDYNVTATFFLNGGLFNQPEYNEKIINWLVDHGYSIANHSYSHADFSTTSQEKTMEEIGKMYNILDNIIPNRYEKIVALPYGSPYVESASSFPYILNGEFSNKQYNTVSTLRVGWESELSPFHKSFNKTFLKRIRAYDNNGQDFDIEMNFKMLKSTRYISDGDFKTIVIPEKYSNNLNNENNHQVITY